MEKLAHKIFTGRVMHKRLFPKVNSFTYNIYYLALNLMNAAPLPIARNKFAALSYFDKDHGACDGSDLTLWAKNILESYKIDAADGDIVLIAMPRILGYVFNPVSFWLCLDKHRQLRAVICEVNNTFGERHSYICVKPDQSPILKDDVISGEKLFHVSPFLKREGTYRFRFRYEENRFGAFIDFYNDEGHKQLITYLDGDLENLTKATARKAFWSNPLVTFRAVYLIHWQALKLVLKKITYIKKPEQLPDKHSLSNNLTKN